MQNQWLVDTEVGECLFCPPLFRLPESSFSLEAESSSFSSTISQLCRLAELFSWRWSG